MRPVVILVGVLSVAAISIGTATVLRSRPRTITVAARAIAPPAPSPSAILIGEPSLVAFLPDSGPLSPELAALDREFRAALPRAARIAAEHRFRFYVRASAQLQVWGPDHAPIRGALVDSQDVGFLIAAPRYPAIRLRGTYSDSALADALARYAALIGTPEPLHKPS